MNTNEELKTRPDFEKLAEEAAAKDNSIHTSCGSYEKGCEDIWTTHVEPLQAKLEKFESVNQRRGDYSKGYRIGWTDHVEPLRAENLKKEENEYVTVQTPEWHYWKTVAEEVKSENQKLRDQLKEFTEWCEGMDYKPDEYYSAKKLLKLDKTNP